MSKAQIGRRPLTPNQFMIAGHNPDRFLKESSLASYVLDLQATYFLVKHWYIRVYTDTFVIKIRSAWSWYTSTDIQIL